MMILQSKGFRISSAAVFSLLAALFAACGTVASGTGALAEVAGSLGLIDQNTASAIVRSTDAIGRAAEEITPEQEYYIGRAVGANILTSYKVYTQNPALTGYLNRICNTIAINSPKPELFNGYYVAILDSAEINAFATSGGHIFITRGLIDCTKSEDALAAVIAHEIGHIQLQHSIKAIKTSRITQALLETGSAAATVATNQLSLGELTDIFDESVNDIVTQMVNNGYSQDQEFDADSLALSLLASAGYEPSSLVDMLRSLEQAQPGRPGGFNKTHPAPGQRITNVNKTLKNYTVPDTRPFRVPRYQASL
jgi:predicted Zn-dependent protease